MMERIAVIPQTFLMCFRRPAMMNERFEIARVSRMSVPIMGSAEESVKTLKYAPRMA